MNYRVRSEWKKTESGWVLHVQATDIETKSPIPGIPNLEATFEVVTDFAKSAYPDRSIADAKQRFEEMLKAMVEERYPGSEEYF